MPRDEADPQDPGNSGCVTPPKDGKESDWLPRWKNGDWCVDFYVAGSRIRRRLGIRAREAEEIAKEVAKRLYELAWRRALDPNPSPTFAEAAGLYMQAFGQEHYVNPLIVAFGTKIRCDEIDHVAILRVAAKLARNCLPTTMHRKVTVPTEAILSFIKGTHKPRGKAQDRTRKRWLTPEEFERLIDVASEPEKAGVRDPHRTILKVLAFMVGTGCGPAETYNVNIEDFNWSTNEVLIRESKTAARTRWVHMPKRTVELIGELPTSGRAFLAPNGEPFAVYEHAGGQLSKQFRKLCEAAGLDAKVVQYTLRHTWATWLSAQVGDHDLLLDRGGWKKSDTARGYRKRAPADLAKRLFEHGWDFRERFDS